MKKVLTEGTRTLPSITFDADSAELRIEGWSFSEKPQAIFDPVVRMIENYAIEQDKSIDVHVNLHCFNTASGKCLMNVVQAAGGMKQANGRIIWHFDRDDEETREWGEDISHATGIPFEFIPYQKKA
ncbi:MAG: hypothetical protein RL226_883 [Bacteroidota bacterium]|jgi:hypothetical protein